MTPTAGRRGSTSSRLRVPWKPDKSGLRWHGIRAVRFTKREGWIHPECRTQWEIPSYDRKTRAPDMATRPLDLIDSCARCGGPLSKIPGIECPHEGIMCKMTKCDKSCLIAYRVKNGHAAYA